ncbi:MAG: pentapeptide repeat-containing protein [Bacteroidales bacterium]|nr:pentapeptide repeat-containing protein [Bacteroidales bacterium]
MRLFKSKKDELIQYEIQSFYKPEIKERPPEPDDTKLERITAEKAITILRQNLPLENKRIAGDLILSTLDIENPFELDTEDGRKVQMAGLPGYQDFARLPFQTKIEIRKCIFEGKVIMTGMDFKKEVRFISTRFCAELDFQFAIFNNALTFYSSIFQGRAIFSDSTIWDNCFFDRTIFSGAADFYNVAFQKGASFKNTVFHAHCTYSNSKFKSSMILEPCLNFANVICHEPAYFMDTSFDGIADFQGAQFRRKVDFTNATFKYINLKQAHFGWLEIKWEQIGYSRLLFGTVTLKGVDVNKKYITEDEFNKYFLQRSDTLLSEKHRQFDILKGIFLKQGDFVSADNCFYDWKQMERKKTKIGMNPESWIVKVFHFLNWITCGYGVKPIRTLFFASVIIFIFSIIYTLIDPSFNITVKEIVLNNNILNVFMGNLEYSLLVFMNFAGTMVQAESIQHLLYVIERILGWFTLLLFVTTYTRIMLR